MKPQNKTGLKLNCLEDRSVPAVAASLTNGTLLVTGSPTGAEIRVDGLSNPVHVYDGQQVIGSFNNVVSIEARPDKNANLRIDLGRTNNYDSLFVNLDGGVNSVRINGGIVEKVTVFGRSGGSDRISMVGLQSTNLLADVGLGYDELLVRKSEIVNVTVNSVESMELNSSEFGSAALSNQLSSMNINSSATIKHDLNVIQRGGSMNLGGQVGGDVTYRNARGLTPGNLVLTGTIMGSLQMTGSESNDQVALAKGSQVFGSIDLALWGMDDRVALEGSIGQKETPVKIKVDMGAGNDQLSIHDSAIIHGGGSIAMGAGRDSVSIAKLAYFQWLGIDGGADADSIAYPVNLSNIALSNFEAFVI